MHPAPKLATKIEYWYGEYEKKARKTDMAYIDFYFDDVTFRQIDGLGHGELVISTRDPAVLSTRDPAVLS